MSLSLYSQNLSLWANRLNANGEWTRALESAFDSIGFTEDYIASAAAVAAKHLYRRKAIKDNVWGMVEVDPCGAWLIDSPLLQRLRYIKQLGVSYLTYPGAQHSRFEHSIGVFHVANRLLDAFQRNESNERDPSSVDSALKAASYDDSSYEAVIVRLAALLHDVGHIPFSHACERFFQGSPDTTTIGPFSTKAFWSDFQLSYRGIASGEKVVATRENKDLSEVFSAAIVLSNRFRRFLKESCPGELGKRYEEVSCDIAALILGDPINDHDRALPQLISGPFDADKIDYMLRDAHACGLDLGIDVSRLFFRASVYEVRQKEAITDQVQAPIIKDAPLPFKVFLLDQTGTDAALEMGFARLSLYSRVYYHQLTLNAEAQLFALLDIASSRSADSTNWSNFLNVWSHSDQSLLYTLSHDTDVQVVRAARNILERRLLKRAACFSIDLILPSALGNALPSPALQESLGSLHEQAHDNLVKLLKDSSLRPTLEAQVKNYCRSFKDQLLKCGEPADNLPSDDEPEFVRFILPRDSKRALLPQALVITASREVSQQRQRDASYLDSGRIANQKSYLLVPGDWRELALLALQRSIYDCEGLTINREARQTSSTLPASSTPSYRALFRPVLALSASANESRINWRNVQALQSKLVDQYEGAELLIDPDRALVNETVLAAPGLASFEGENGWTLRSGSELDLNRIGAFIRQFPPIIRREAAVLVQRLTVLNRVTTCELILNALRGRISGNVSESIALVPLTPSSGERLRGFLKGQLLGELASCSLVSSLEDALAEGNSYKSIVFIDDNIVSGTQCFDQLGYWLDVNVKSRPSDANYFKSKLSPREVAELKKKSVTFAFAVGNDREKESLSEHMRIFTNSHGLQLCSTPFYFGQGLSEHSGAVDSPSPINSDLREFLRTVGRQVIREHVKRDGRYATEALIASECERRALGYSNAEGMLATSLNVPSSTYTALWCPGTYLSPTSNGRQIPWLPLLIRDGQEASVIVF